MAHSYVKIWVHAVFGTKYRQNLIVPEIKKTVHQIIIDELKGLGCSLMAINSMPDHVHILFLLNRNKNIAEVMKQVKGGSSYRINQQDLTPEKFAWQVGYGAFSVSESVIDKVKDYIKNQEMHHQKLTFQEEYKRFVELHGFIFEGDTNG
ncbi:IS200/IS605 family transposase [Hugenholtzia roseola]|uniref:IS200/IS605 family transposase n=1 Tax=Hugenholtzia roseola TaxID=1002 RepID=UPI00047B41B8|nr:IS200/IS605 family transposase [Hugenholtzia roseola]